MIHISEILDNYRPCFKLNPATNHFSWFLLKDINSYNSGTDFLLDNSSWSNFSSENLSYLSKITDSNLYSEGETYRKETSLIGGSKKEILEQIKKLEINNATSLNSGTSKIAGLDKRSVIASRRHNKQLVTFAFDEATFAFASGTSFIYVLHKNQIEKLIKLGIPKFEEYIIKKINNKKREIIK